MRKYFLTLLLALLPAALWAQGTIYTKSARLADFPQKTTKIVLSGQQLLDEVLKEEITSRWRISPYEFCTEEEFDAFKTVSRYYFLHFEYDDEFTWMQLYKGGPANGNPLMRRPKPLPPKSWCSCPPSSTWFRIICCRPSSPIKSLIRA